MILAIDIGNTNIVLGCVEGKKTYFIERLSTDKAKTELEYAVSLKYTPGNEAFFEEHLECIIAGEALQKLALV